MYFQYRTFEPQKPLRQKVSRRLCASLCSYRLSGFIAE
ncbi:MAG: hypothetical protein AVDCRST_MAG96-464 [uncultured Segetibacter sp.]|uniref:Uncharacterized protein n=1 Tax=uncultured Segetibacter sp. TaxID=481133 RepID=A0A6J4RID3_9BACT|nr:MAG: hypothetical protein AVDCRST_MAG96-464 [uncultured Segetibacter sp.]